MMENRNKTLAFTLLALIVACVVVFIMQRDEGASIDVNLFKISDLDKIDQVTLEKGGEKTSIRFSEGRWKINGKFDADRNLVKVLFATLDQAAPKREITGPKHDSMATAISTTGAKVTLLQNGEIRRTFIAGGNKQKTQAYFLDADGKLYLVNIPGYRVYVSGIFEAGEGMWRDKRVFNFNWRNFKELTTHFPAQPADDFHMALKQNFFGIDGIDKVDTTKVNDYLDAVSLLQAAEFLSDKTSHAYDTLFNKPWAFEINVTDISGRSYALKIWTPRRGAANVIGANGNNELMLFERDVISPLARKKTFFVAR